MNKRYRRLRAVLVGGGGLLQQCFNTMWRGLIDIEIPFIVFGVGVNRYHDFRFPTPPDLVRQIHSHSLYFRVRDNMTARYVEDATGISPSVGICPSIAYLRSIPIQRISQPTHLFSSNTSLSFLRTRLTHVASNLDLIYDETNHVNGLTRQLVGQYKRAALIVSSRLHGCIFALAFSIPFVAIALDEKISAFLDTHAPTTYLVNEDKLCDVLTTGFLKQVMDQGPYPDTLDRKIHDNECAMSIVLSILNA
jgi:polysaccharide pyruvyl transferase WcaK-like protein